MTALNGFCNAGNLCIAIMAKLDSKLTQTETLRKMIMCSHLRGDKEKYECMITPNISFVHSYANYAFPLQEIWPM